MSETYDYLAEARALFAEIRRLRETVGLLHGWEDRAKKAEGRLFDAGYHEAELVAENRAMAATIARVEALADAVENRMMATAKPSEIRAALANDTGVVPAQMPPAGLASARGSGGAVMADERIKVNWSPSVLAALGNTAPLKEVIQLANAEVRLLAVCRPGQVEAAEAEVKRRTEVFNGTYEDRRMAALESVTRDIAMGRL